MKNLICLAVMLAFVSPALAQKADESSALESLVNTERAFARTSEERGTREAFMAFIADDGILFRPTAVRGKQWMTEHPLPRSEKRDLLSWQPTFADVAGSGDMGYTTGPWEYRKEIHDARPVAFGNFVTVWKRTVDGWWRFAVDLGISNPEPAQALVPWQLPAKSKAPKVELKRLESEPSMLRARDLEFAKASEARGAQIAFSSYAAKEVRVCRDGNFPFLGIKMASAALPPRLSVWTWQPAFAEVSQSDDLGYTYGTYQLTNTNSTPHTVETGNYLRIWKKQNGTWKVVVDVANPLPEAKKT